MSRGWTRIDKATFLTQNEKRAKPALGLDPRVGYGPVEVSDPSGLTPSDDIASKYSPDQPRVPAGQSGGGQWISDLYMLDREQMRAYGNFRRKLSRMEREMPASKAQHRLQHSEDTIPAEFRSFCASLAMGLKYAGSSPQSGVRYAINVHSHEESEAALRYLDRIAAGNHDAGELQRLWDHCAADMDLTSEGDPRPFFLAVRSEMAKLVKPTAARRHDRR